MLETPHRPDDAGLLPEIVAVTKKIEDRTKRTVPTMEKELSLESLMNVSPELRERGVEIAKATGHLNPVEAVTATAESRDQQKAIFLEKYDAGEEYNPEFTYAAAEAMDLKATREQLLVIYDKIRAQKFLKEDRLNRLARVILLAKIDDDLAACDLVDGIKDKDEAQIGRALKRMYQGTDPTLVQLAYLDYAQRTVPEEAPAFIEKAQGLLTEDEQAHLATTKLYAQDIKKAFEWGLDQLGILRSPGGSEHGYQVLIDPEASSIDVRDKSIHGPTIVIPIKREIKARYLLVLLDHELVAHARQSMNGERLFGIGGGALKFNEEGFYEGLAMYYEDSFNQKMYGHPVDDFDAPYVLAVHAAEQGNSFHGVFALQLEIHLHHALKIAPDQPLPDAAEIDSAIYTDARDSAWLITYRVMRGHVNMSNPEKFAMSKDIAYFRGRILQKQLVERQLGYLNEAAVLNRGGLQAIVEFHIKETDVPIQRMELGLRYWEEVLKPRYEAQ